MCPVSLNVSKKHTLNAFLNKPLNRYLQRYYMEKDIIWFFDFVNLHSTKYEISVLIWVNYLSCILQLIRLIWHTYANASSLIILNFLFLLLFFCFFSVSLSHKGEAYTSKFFLDRAWFLNENWNIQYSSLKRTYISKKYRLDWKSNLGKLAKLVFL